MTAAQSAATASRLLARFGEPVEITSPAPSGFDPITGEPSGAAGTGTTYTGNGYPGDYMATDVDGTHIKQGDVRLILELIEQRPDRGWRARVDGVTYRIEDVKTVRKTGGDVIYICQLRAD